MTIDKFKAELKTIIKYNGDVDKYIDDNIRDVNIPINLNDRIEGALTETGVNLYNNTHEDKRKKGERVDMQIHDMIRTFGTISYAGMLPLVDCKIVK